MRIEPVPPAGEAGGRVARRAAVRRTRPIAVAVDARMVRSSGIGTYLRNVVPRLAGDDGSRIALLGDPERLRRERLDRCPGTSVHRCSAPIYTVREQLELPRVVPPGVDLFWSPHYNIPLLHGGPLVVTVHDILHVARPEFVRGAHRRLYARAMLDAVRRRAARVICVSSFTADELMRHGAFTADRLEVVHPGVDERWRTAVRAPSPRPGPYFLYIGNVKPHKNLARLIAAFERVRDELPHDLVIVGRKEGLLGVDAGVQRAARRLGDRVGFTGEVSDRMVRRYVAHAEALVLPSMYEGFGLPALEAMAAGCPAVVARAASLPEVCGDAALYFEPTDVDAIAGALRRVVRDRPLRDELIAAGRERAARFDWDVCAGRTREVMEAVDS